MAMKPASSEKKPGPKTAFGIVLRQRRTELGMSQDELSARSGYQRAYISQVERGLNSPTLGMIFDVSAVLDIRPSTLVSRTEKLSGLQ